MYIIEGGMSWKLANYKEDLALLYPIRCGHVARVQTTRNFFPDSWSSLRPHCKMQFRQFRENSQQEWHWEFSVRGVRGSVPCRLLLGLPASLCLVISWTLWSVCQLHVPGHCLQPIGGKLGSYIGHSCFPRVTMQTGGRSSSYRYSEFQNSAFWSTLQYSRSQHTFSGNSLRVNISGFLGHKWTLL